MTAEESSADVSELPFPGYRGRPGHQAPVPCPDRPGFWILCPGEARTVVRADQDGPIRELWGREGTPQERERLAHTIREGSAWGVPSTVHAAAQRLLWEGVTAGDRRIVGLALEAGANPHEPSWALLDGGPAEWDTPLSWLFNSRPLHCPRPIPYRRDLFDLLWNAGGQTDPRPDDCCSGIAMAWIHRAEQLGPAEVVHVGRALLNARPAPAQRHQGATQPTDRTEDDRAAENRPTESTESPDGTNGWGLLTARNENGWTPLDQALTEGCGLVLEFLEEVCRERGRPLSDLMNRSTTFRAPVPSVVAFCYGLRGQTQQLKQQERTWATWATRKINGAMQERRRTAQRTLQTIERIGAQAIQACPWALWRSVLPDRTSPLTSLLSALGAPAGLKVLREQPGFNWEDPMIMDPVAVRALNRWRRGILGLHHERMKKMGQPPYGWRRQHAGEDAGDHSPGTPISWMRIHPALSSFRPILERTVRQTVQDFALGTHRLAQSSDPADQAKIERARLTIFERSVPGPQERAGRRTRRSI